MALEVENKYPLAEVEPVLRRWEELGGRRGGLKSQVDQYYSHPCRDLGQTDEALRIRRQGDDAFITYKGPKLDQQTKTRREIELPLGDPAAFDELLTSLGFQQYATVSKQRQVLHLDWQGFAVEGAVDEVEELGSFLELEIVAEDDSLDAARAALQSLAEALGLGASQRQSYLELVLKQRRAPGG